MKEETFNEDDSIPTTTVVDVNPEFSYLISVSYSTKYGHLSPSKNVTSYGEFEMMMTKRIGCYIQNDFYFKNNIPTAIETNVESALTCSTKCKNSNNCEEGWSFHLATGKCLFIGQDESLKIDVLQPTSHIQETDRTVGWATGLRACYEGLVVSCIEISIVCPWQLTEMEYGQTGQIRLRESAGLALDSALVAVGKAVTVLPVKMEFMILGSQRNVSHYW